MNLITIDFETHYSADYSLSKMSPLSYVRDPRFQLISCAIKVNSNPTAVVFGATNIHRAFDSLRSRVEAGILLGHNMSGFDSYICAYVLGLRPKLWACTAAMARPLHAKTVGVSLAKLVQHYAADLQAMGVAQVKDSTALVQTRGKRLEDFTAEELAAMKVYNRNDTDQCWALFQLLRKHYSSAELWQIDMLTRMRTEPQFALDTALLNSALEKERYQKRERLIALGAVLNVPDTIAPGEDTIEWVRSELASAPKFSALLQSLDVEVPTKASPTNPENTIPALSKTDEEFLALQEHPDPLVSAAAQARLSVKSTLLETRIEKFLQAGENAGGLLPVPLSYCGADTTGRDSGQEYNCQNLPRINPQAPRNSDALRLSLAAPPGKTVIVADQSGIELRVNHFLWQEPASMTLYQNSPDKADLYRAFAAIRFNKDADAIDKTERQFGKICQLGLGFGAGWGTFQRIAKIMGGLALDDEQAQDAVATWRGAYTRIVGGWRTCGEAIKAVSMGGEMTVDNWGHVTTTSEGLHLPSGRVIRYPHLREEDDGTWPDGRSKKSWFYGDGRHKARLTGPKVTENIVQALARDSVFDCTLEFYKRTGLRPALRVHDELVYVVDTPNAQELLDELQRIMRTPPAWWPELVVWSEGDTAPTYGAAK